MAGTIFLQDNYPSWLYVVKMGATTIWERWNSIMPGGPMIQFAYQMSMAELTAQAPQAKPLYEMVIEALNAQYR